MSCAALWNSSISADPSAARLLLPARSRTRANGSKQPRAESSRQAQGSNALGKHEISRRVPATASLLGTSATRVCMVGRVRSDGACETNLTATPAGRHVVGTRSLVPSGHPQRRFDAVETRSSGSDRGGSTGDNRRQLFGPLPGAHRRSVSGLQLEVGTYLAPPPPASHGERDVGGRQIAVGKGPLDMRDADRPAPGGDTTRQRRVDRQAGCKWLLDGSAVSAAARKCKFPIRPGIESRPTASSRWWRPTRKLTYCGGTARSAKPQTRTSPTASSNPLRRLSYPALTRPALPPARNSLPGAQA